MSVEAYALCELVWHKPCHGLVEDFGLVVDTFNRKEDLPEGLSVHDIQLPLGSESCTVLDE